MGSPYKVTEFKKGFWIIEEDFVRMFLAEGSEDALLIDTGLGGGDIRGLAESLTAKPISVVNTHGDGDHVGGNGQFEAIHMHPSEYDYYLFERPERGNENLVPVWEGHIFDLGTRCFEVVLIPGHTPGSIALFDRANRVLFAGDTLQSTPIFMFGRGRSLIALEQTLNKLLNISGEIDTIYPSHGNLEESPEIITGMLEGLKLIKSGSVEGRDIKEPRPCKLYDSGGAKFLLK